MSAAPLTLACDGSDVNVRKYCHPPAGAAPVASGAQCRFELRPSWQGQTECRMAVYCGDQWLYGTGTTGYLTCFGTNGRPTGADDGNPTPHGNDPMVRWRGNEVIVEDVVASGHWLVALTLGPEVPPIGTRAEPARATRQR